MKKTILASSVLALSGAPFLVNAEEGQVYINPAVGYMMFDSERDLDDDFAGVLGVEYQFHRNWGVEILALQGDSESDTGGDIDLDVYRIDALYYLNEGRHFKPYLGVGIGRAEFDFELGDSDEEQYNAGVGVRYLINKSLSARADVRGIYGEDGSTWDSLATLGISYAFGGSDREPRESAPVLPSDQDGDGVVDGADQCPNTPAGVKVDTSGCPIDSDKDGVADHIDECPDTAPGVRVDSKGCELKRVKVESMELKIEFATNSSVVPASASSEIQKVADFMVKHSTLVVDIEGHSDSTGEADYNRQLSQRRADAVAKVLVDRFGIDKSRVRSLGFGEDKPIASNDTKEGRRSNRRVVAVLQKEVEEVLLQKETQE